ncbi:hypothetical protein [Haloplanus halobius]|uniref:hypothetical protein n=1 Tax=Haloplanus halobius TaxID=2934938 RepID=UPI00200F3A7E|nr:hypothetical protein [Haloplanus sp. XH21]
MNPAATILAERGEGPAVVELEDGREYEIAFDEVDVEGFHASGTDREDEYAYRIDRPPHSDEPLALERRRLPEGDWTELGRVAFVEDPRDGSL